MPRHPSKTNVNFSFAAVDNGFFSGYQFQPLPFQTGTIYINEIQTHISALCKYIFQIPLHVFRAFPDEGIWTYVFLMWHRHETSVLKPKDKYQNDRRVNLDTYSYHFGYGKYCRLFLASVSLSTDSCIWFDFYFFGGSRRYEGMKNAA